MIIIENAVKKSVGVEIFKAIYGSLSYFCFYFVYFWFLVFFICFAFYRFAQKKNTKDIFAVIAYLSKIIL